GTSDPDEGVLNRAPVSPGEICCHTISSSPKSASSSSSSTVPSSPGGNADSRSSRPSCISSSCSSNPSDSGSWISPWIMTKCSKESSASPNKTEQSRFPYSYTSPESSYSPEMSMLLPSATSVKMSSGKISSQNSGTEA